MLAAYIANKAMKSLINKLALCSILGAAFSGNAATVTVDPGATWNGYMNVFNLPSAGGGYQFGSGWGTADLTASFSGPTLTLGPNTIGDPNPYWYTPSGGPGATGNKIMEANFYVEPAAGTYTGVSMHFIGLVLSNTMAGKTDANGNGWTANAFIKDFASDYSSSIEASVPLVNGAFDINLTTINDPSRHVQYGFQVKGPDVWVTDVAPYGNIQITADAVPEPSQWAMMGVVMMMGVSLGVQQWRRRASA